MKSRAVFPAAALVIILAALAACATQAPTLAGNEATPLQLCDQVTGTRIQSNRSECAPVGLPLRSFSAEQLQSTGEIDISRALRELDPRFW